MQKQTKRILPTIWLDEVDSTNEYLKKLAIEGATAGTTVIAAYQSAGKGRRSRSFLSPSGGIYLSYLLYPDIKKPSFHLLTSYVGLIVCQTLADFGARVTIKWPNDIILKDRKLCGILCELETSSVRPAAILGIGINVTAAPSDFDETLKDKAISIRQANIKATKQELIEKLLENLDKAFMEDNMMEEDPAPHLEQIRKKSCVLGKRVTVQDSNGTWDGIAADILEDGSLLISKSGKRVVLDSGEVSIRGILGYKL